MVVWDFLMRRKPLLLLLIATFCAGWFITQTALDNSRIEVPLTGPTSGTAETPGVIATPGATESPSVIATSGTAETSSVTETTSTANATIATPADTTPTRLHLPIVRPILDIRQTNR